MDKKEDTWTTMDKAKDSLSEKVVGLFKTIIFLKLVRNSYVGDVDLGLNFSWFWFGCKIRLTILEMLIMARYRTSIVIDVDKWDSSEVWWFIL